LKKFTEKFGELSPGQLSDQLQQLITQFLHETPNSAPEKKREPVKAS